MQRASFTTTVTVPETTTTAYVCSEEW